MSDNLRIRDAHSNTTGLQPCKGEHNILRPQVQSAQILTNLHFESQLNGRYFKPGCFNFNTMVLKHSLFEVLDFSTKKNIVFLLSATYTDYVLSGRQHETCRQNNERNTFLEELYSSICTSKCLVTPKATMMMRKAAEYFPWRKKVEYLMV